MASENSRLIEKPDDRAGQAAELTQRFNDWTHPRHSKIGLAERYARGELYYGVRLPFGDYAQYGFVIGASEIPLSCVGVSPLYRHVALQEVGLNFDLEKAFVLPNNVEAMEGEKKVIPSFIRFEIFDDATFGVGKPLYEFVPLVSAFCKNLGAINNGKVNLFAARYAEPHSESTSENIEAASENVDVGASLDHERERQRLFVSRYYDIIRGITWRIYNDHINVDIDPRFESLLKGWELGYGPVNGSLSGQQIVSHSYLTAGIEITPDMEREGALWIQNLTDCTYSMAKDVARELFLAMLSKNPKFQHLTQQLANEEDRTVLNTDPVRPC